MHTTSEPGGGQFRYGKRLLGTPPPLLNFQILFQADEVIIVKTCKKYDNYYINGYKIYGNYYYVKHKIR
jgi:hypothetical protein